ncbi:MAG: hypothetical protein GKR89_21100 [Candidatus Latescibacteria bacterium]|nr:hypothetical protein [Candidatus Latescibacterota bacterium]
MDVNLQQFRRDGYLVLKNVVPPDRLADLRLTVELMVDHEKKRSTRQRRNDEPRGGAWYSNAQPRLGHHSVAPETADFVDFCLGDTTHGVSHQLMQAPQIALTAFGVLCSGLIDYGYTDWHRDASSAEQAPLGGLQYDLIENGAGYVQWNIALYEDEVFWILPGSHKQPTTEAQRRQLLRDPRTALEGGVPIHLQPGDGIVYPNIMMHWGSFYSSRLRRTIHLSYRSFGGQIMSYHNHVDWYHDGPFLQHLGGNTRAYFEHTAQLYDKERDRIETAFRAVIAGDGPTYGQRLAQLHPGPRGRMVSTILLCRTANKIVAIHSPELAPLSPAQRQPLIDGTPPAYYAEDMARRFTAEDAAVLKQRFAPLNARLQADAQHVHQHYTQVHTQLVPQASEPPNFESRPLRTFNHDMPKDFGVEEFIESWRFRDAKPILLMPAKVTDCLSAPRSTVFH